MALALGGAGAGRALMGKKPPNQWVVRIASPQKPKRRLLAPPHHTTRPWSTIRGLPRHTRSGESLLDFHSLSFQNLRRLPYHFFFFFWPIGWIFHREISHTLTMLCKQLRQFYLSVFPNRNQNVIMCQKIILLGLCTIFWMHIIFCHQKATWQSG